ncbi:MAG: hypothetical protein MJ166_07955 [Clostridia bacterium]|nr:hypothetical protein [Clostridia bacterium]
MKKNFVIGFIVSLVIVAIMLLSGFVQMSTRKSIEAKSDAVEAYVIGTPPYTPYMRKSGVITFKVEYKYKYDGVEREYMNEHYFISHAVDNGTPQTLYVDPNTKLVVLDASSKDGETAAFVIAAGFLINALFQLGVGFAVMANDTRKTAAVMFLGMGICAALTFIGLTIMFSILKSYTISVVGLIALIFIGLFLNEVRR